MTCTYFRIPAAFWLRSGIVNLQLWTRATDWLTVSYTNINLDHGGSDGKNRSNALNVKGSFLNFLEGQTSNTPNAYINKVFWFWWLDRVNVSPFRKCLETCDRCSLVLSTSGEESQNNNQKIHPSETRNTLCWIQCSSEETSHSYATF